MSITSAEAVDLLEYVLYETPATAQANAADWVTLSQIVASVSTIAGAAAAMTNADEVGIPEQVIRYFEGALARAPSSSEIAYYVTIAETGLTGAQLSQGAAGVSQATWNVIAADIVQSPESHFASAGGALVQRLYESILGREPSAAEAAYYAAQQAAGYGPELLLQEFANSPEYQNRLNPILQQNLIAFGGEVASGEIGLVGAHSHHAPIAVG